MDNNTEITNSVMENNNIHKKSKNKSKKSSIMEKLKKKSNKNNDMSNSKKNHSKKLNIKNIFKKKKSSQQKKTEPMGIQLENKMISKESIPENNNIISNENNTKKDESLPSYKFNENLPEEIDSNINNKDSINHYHENNEQNSDIYNTNVNIPNIYSDEYNNVTSPSDVLEDKGDMFSDITKIELNSQPPNPNLVYNFNVDFNNKNNSSRRSSTTIDSCKTINNDNENDNETHMLTGKNNHKNNNNKDNDHFSNSIDDITLLKNKAKLDIKHKKLNMDKQLGLKLNNDTQKNENANLNKFAFLNNPKYVYSEQICQNNNLPVYSINTAIVNMNKPNVDASSSDVELPNNSTNSNNDTTKNNNKNKDKEDSHSRTNSNNSNSSVSTLNNANLKYMNKINSKNEMPNNNSYLKSYNQRHGSLGSLMNSPENKNNIITKKAIINNALKNNNINMLYTKRHNSMNNLNKLKLNINNQILLQTTSPKSSKSSKSSSKSAASIDESLLASPLTQNMKRMNGYKYNDILLNRRANSLKKDGMGKPLENHCSINSAHAVNGSISNTSINSNSSNGSINKGPLFYNQISVEDLDGQPFVINKSSDSDIPYEISNEMNNEQSIKDFNFYKQLYKFINLNDLTFKNKQIEQEFEQVHNSLEEINWRSDIPMECCLFCIINFLINLFCTNMKYIRIQFIITFLPVIIILSLIKFFKLSYHSKIKNISSVVIFSLIGPINYLILVFSNAFNSYMDLIFTLNLIIWIFAGHFVLHSNYKYTRYSITICYLLCLIPTYYKIFSINTSPVNNTGLSYMNSSIYSNYSSSQYPFTHQTKYNHLYSDEKIASYYSLNHDSIFKEPSVMNSLLKYKKEKSSFVTNQKDEILAKEIEELMERGNSIFLYADQTLISLNPKDEIQTKCTKLKSLLSNPDIDFDIYNNDNKEMIINKKDNYRLEKVLHECFSQPYKPTMESGLLNKNKNFHLNTYDEYELWIVVYESPSQPLKLNNFIIKYYYEKEKSKRDLKEQLQSTKEEEINITKLNYILNEIVNFISRNLSLMNMLTYLALLVSCYMINKLKYELDLSLKLQFLSNSQYIHKAGFQLDNLFEGDLSRSADFDSPIEKAIGIINQLLSQTDKNSQNYELLSSVLVYLNSSNLLLPDLERQLQGFVELEDEQKQWLLYEIAQQNYSYYDDSDNSSENSPSSVSSPYIFHELTTIDILSLIDDNTLQLLEKVDDYNFPIFEFCGSTPRPLLTMSYHLFVKSGLIGRLHLNTEKFLNFIKEVEEGYHTDVTFHNACHVTDVLHCMYYFTTVPNIAINFKDWDLLAMFVAACIHDYDHPGLSNKFLIQIGDPLAVLYNDRSVLENHHCAMSFSILFKEQNNFLEHLDKEKFNDFRETVISLVLATDLAEHFQILSLFKKKILNIPKCVQREDKILLMKILIKCADVSNATKERSIYKKWVDGIMEEFYRQGDREKELNIPLSPFGNRDVPKPNSCQKSFVEFIATPIFEVLAEWVYTCQSKPEVDEHSKSPTRSDTHSSIKSKRNSISNCNLYSGSTNNETSDNNNLSISAKSSRRSSLSPIKASDMNETNENNASSSTTTFNNTPKNINSLSSPPSPILQERPYPGKKLSVGSIFKTDLPNRLKSSLKSKESAINLMMRRERDIESRKKIDVIINGLQENRKWVEANGLGA